MIGGFNMKKSKYCKMTRINEDVYAVYNSLLMEPLYVNKETATKIKYNNFNELSSLWFTCLFKGTGPIHVSYTK